MLVVKYAGKTDLVVVKDLAHFIWPITYTGIISSEQIGYMLEQMYSLEVLELQLNQKQQFVVLYESGRAVGFASFGVKQNASEQVYRLNKLYILPAEQGHGAGKFLLDFVLQAVSNLGGSGLELNVNKQNPARNFYARNGFQVIREEVLDIGNGYVMDDYVMHRTISLAASDQTSQQQNLPSS